MSINNHQQHFSQIDPLPKLKNVDLFQTLGQGAFAFVKKAKLKQPPNTIFAIKFIHLETSKRYGLSNDDIAKEVIIHERCSKNDNIIKVLTCDLNKRYMWICLELAEGGDLFDKIEPDLGISDNQLVRFYFKQLINAIQYLHLECGVAHRDLKPENILLDADGNLKLADFGLATVFKSKKNGTKKSFDIVGSPPYMAPDLLKRKEGYFPWKSDIWSCGILLFVLLTGTTPWYEPTTNDIWYSNFIAQDNKPLEGSWSKLGIDELSLLRKILQPESEDRIDLVGIKNNHWVAQPLPFADKYTGLCTDPENLFLRLTNKLKVSLSDEDFVSCTQSIAKNDYLHENHDFKIVDRFNFSQPVVSKNQRFKLSESIANDSYLPNNPNDFFSQVPSQRVDHLNLQAWLQNDPSLIQYTQQPVEENKKLKNLKIFNHNVNNIFTRFYSSANLVDIVATLENILIQLKLNVKANILNDLIGQLKEFEEEQLLPIIIKIKTLDTRAMPLLGIIKIEVVNNVKCITFLKTKGDPLEWRRVFKKVTVLCRELVLTI
ncbi:hypothetical protein ACO0SA_003003 [Hanseniaspora valbyensis]